jgi:tetratricopeptide (TPR) repeat protein
LIRTAAFVVLCALGLTRLQAAENIQLDANEALFAVLAAINAAGYDEGMALPDNSPIRKQLRDYLAKQDIGVLPELQRFYRRHMQKNGVQDLSQYISYALSVKGPPDFEWRTRDVEVPPDALALSDFTPLLQRFYHQANMAELWQRTQPAVNAEMEKYHGPIIAMTSAVDGYLRVPVGGYLGRRFRLFVDLLGAPQQVQTRNYSDDAFVVVTPSGQPKMFDIRHAYLHFEIDPIVIKYGTDLQQREALLDSVQEAPLDENFKTDFVLLANESLIKAVESRLDKNPGEIQQSAKQGFILSPYFAEQLPVFEKQQQGLRFYMEEMTNGLDLKREQARVKTIKFDSSALIRAAKPVTIAPPPVAPLSPSGQTLEKAEQYYTARNLDEAKQLYVKSLEQTGSSEEHAQAWYGLARISVLQNQPEAASKLFEKTLGASPDPQTKAWSYVYLARLSRAANDEEGAAKYYKEALAVEGASEGAVKAAQTESKSITKN